MQFTDTKAEAGKNHTYRVIAVNDVSDPSIGFHSEQNALTVIWEGGEQRLPRADKATVAEALLRVVGERMAKWIPQGSATTIAGRD